MKTQFLTLFSFPRFPKPLMLFLILAIVVAFLGAATSPLPIEKIGNKEMSSRVEVVSKHLLPIRNDSKDNSELPESKILVSCAFDSIKIHIQTGCDNQGTQEWGDDTFTANVKVYYHDKPSTGTLDLTEDGTASIPVSSIGADSCIFQNVVFLSDGSPIKLRATFSDLQSCTRLFTNLGSAPAQCSVCGCAGNSCNQAYPSCWPHDLSSCDSSINYAPDSNAPELTPLKYIKVVLHVMQKEDPAHVGENPPVVHPTDPGNYSIGDTSLLKSWFYDPDKGLNARYSNLCDSPNDGSPWIKDARIRFVTEIQFHPNNQGWGTGFSGCGFNGPSYPSGNLKTNYIDNITDPNTKNALHVFLTGCKWVPMGNGNPAIPDDDDCYWYCPGGYTDAIGNCPNWAVISGNYYTYLAGTDTTVQDTQILKCKNDYEGDSIAQGNAIVGEIFHILGVDHISPLQAHIAGGDFCDDTPFKDPMNKMDCGTGPRCALTRCQLGRIHHTIVQKNPNYERFLISTNPDVYSMTEPSFCSLTEPTLVIPTGANVLWAYPRQIRSNVIVQPGAKLTIKCDVGLPENASITVKATGQLFIDGARLYNNCSENYWNGIIVEGNPNISQIYDIYNHTYYQGYLNIMPGSVIDHARTAVSCQSALGQSLTGGIVQARNASFLNSQVQFVHIRDYHNSNGSGQQVGNVSYFSGCDFLIDDDYSGSFTGNFQQMVRLKSVEGLRFIGCNFTNDIPANQTSTQNDRKYGIFGISAGFSVTGKCNGTTYPCTSYTNSSFTGFDRAIYAGNATGYKTLSVSNTDFTDNIVGIEAISAITPYIVTNNFYVGCNLPVAVPQSASDTACIGLSLYQCTGYKIENNNVYKDTVGAGTINPVGIFIKASGEQPNEVYKNNLFGLDDGNLSNGRNRNTNPLLNQGLQYLCNSNSGNKFDFSIPFEKGASGYGIRGRQGNPSPEYAAGNSFSSSGAISNPEMHIFNRQNDITYYYRNGTTHIPIYYDTAFVMKILNNSEHCPSKLPSGKETGMLSFSEEDSLLQDFNNQNALIETQTYAADMLVRNYLLDTLGIKFDSIRDILLQKGDLQSLFDVVDTWLQEGNDTAAQQALNDIPTQLSLSGGALLEYNYFDTLKTLQIYAIHNEVSDDTLVANNLTTITSIAEAGSYRASVQAQALLNGLNGFTYTPGIVLPSTGSQLQIKAPPHGNVAASPETATLYAQPNPARHTTVFKYHLPEGVETGRIKVTDLNGRLVAEFVVSGKTGSALWNIKEVREGIYFYSLVTDNKIISAKRLVIVK